MKRKRKPEPMKVVSDARAADADILVCGLLTDPLHIPDNLIDVCANCKRAIQHRPHAPKKAKKLCIFCVPNEIKNDPDDTQFVTTQKMLDDLLGYYRKRQ